MPPSRRLNDNDNSEMKTLPSSSTKNVKSGGLAASSSQFQGTSSTPRKSLSTSRRTGCGASINQQPATTLATLPQLVAGTGSVHDYVSKRLRALRRNSKLRDSFFQKMSSLGMQVVCARSHVDAPPTVDFDASSMEGSHHHFGSNSGVYGISPASSTSASRLVSPRRSPHRKGITSPHLLSSPRSKLPPPPHQSHRVYPKTLYFNNLRDRGVATLFESPPTSSRKKSPYKESVVAPPSLSTRSPRTTTTKGGASHLARPPPHHPQQQDIFKSPRRGAGNSRGGQSPRGGGIDRSMGLSSIHASIGQLLASPRRRDLPQHHHHLDGSCANPTSDGTGNQKHSDKDWREALSRSHAVVHLPHGRVVSKHPPHASSSSPLLPSIDAHKQHQLGNNNNNPSSSSPQTVVGVSLDVDDLDNNVSSSKSPTRLTAASSASNVSHINFLPEYDPRKQLMFTNMRDRMVAEKLGLWPVDDRSTGVGPAATGDVNSGVSSCGGDTPMSGVSSTQQTTSSPQPNNNNNILHLHQQHHPSGLSDSMELLDFVNFGFVTDDAVLEACNGIPDSEVYERLMKRDVSIQPILTKFEKLPQPRRAVIQQLPACELQQLHAPHQGGPASSHLDSNMGSWDMGEDQSLILPTTAAGVSPVPNPPKATTHEGGVTFFLTQNDQDGRDGGADDATASGGDGDANDNDGADLTEVLMSSEDEFFTDALPQPEQSRTGTGKKRRTTLPPVNGNRSSSKKRSVTGLSSTAVSKSPRLRKGSPPRPQHASPTYERVHRVRDRIQAQRYDEADLREQRREELQLRLNDAVERKERYVNAPILARKWYVMLNIALAGFRLREAIKAGYRDRFRKIFLYIVARAWLFKARQTASRMATLRLNNIIRRNLPKMLENFAEKRREKRAPIIATFLRHYAHAYKFTSIVKSYMAQVRFAQRVIRKRRMCKMLLASAMRMQWERVLQEMCCNPDGKLFPLQAHLAGVQAQLCRVMQLPTKNVPEDDSTNAAMVTVDCTDGGGGSSTSPPISHSSPSPLMGLVHQLWDPVLRYTPSLAATPEWKGLSTPILNSAGGDVSYDSMSTQRLSLTGNSNSNVLRTAATANVSSAVPATGRLQDTHEDAPPLFRIPPRLRDLIINQVISTERQQYYIDRTAAFEAYLNRLELQEFVEGRRAAGEDSGSTRMGEKHPILIECALWCIEHIPGLRNSVGNGTPLRNILDRLHTEDVNRKKFLGSMEAGGSMLAPKRTSRQAQDPWAGFGASVSPLKADETLLVRRWIATLFLKAEAHRCILEVEDDRQAEAEEQERIRLTERFYAKKDTKKQSSGGINRTASSSKGDAFSGGSPAGRMSPVPRSRVSAGVVQLLLPQSTPNGEFVRKQIENLVSRSFESGGGLQRHRTSRRSVDASDERSASSPSSALMLNKRNSSFMSRGGSGNAAPATNTSNQQPPDGQLNRIRSFKEIKRCESFNVVSVNVPTLAPKQPARTQQPLSFGVPKKTSTTTAAANNGQTTVNGRHRWRSSSRQRFEDGDSNTNGGKKGDGHGNTLVSSGGSSNQLPMLDEALPIGKVFENVPQPQFPRRKMLSHKANVEALILATFTALAVAFQKYLECHSGSGRGGPSLASTRAHAPTSPQSSPSRGGKQPTEDATPGGMFSCSVVRLLQSQADIVALSANNINSNMSHFSSLLPPSLAQQQQQYVSSPLPTSMPPAGGGSSGNKRSILLPGSVLAKYLVGGKHNKNHAMLTMPSNSLVFVPEAMLHGTAANPTSVLQLTHNNTTSPSSPLQQQHHHSSSAASSEKPTIPLKATNLVAIALTKTLLEMTTGPIAPEALVAFASKVCPTTCLDVALFDAVSPTANHHYSEGPPEALPSLTPSHTLSKSNTLIAQTSSRVVAAPPRVSKPTGGAVGGRSRPGATHSNQQVEDAASNAPKLTLMGNVTLPTAVVSGPLVSLTKGGTRVARARVLLPTMYYAYAIALNVSEALKYDDSYRHNFGNNNNNGNTTPSTSAGLPGCMSPQGASAAQQRMPHDSTTTTNAPGGGVSSSSMQTSANDALLLFSSLFATVGGAPPPPHSAVSLMGSKAATSTVPLPQRPAADIRTALSNCFNVSVQDNFTNLILSQTGKSGHNGFGSLLVVDSGPSVWRSFARTCAHQQKMQQQEFNSNATAPPRLHRGGSVRASSSGNMLLAASQYLGTTHNHGPSSRPTRSSRLGSSSIGMSPMQAVPSPPRGSRSGYTSSRPVSRSVPPGSESSGLNNNTQSPPAIVTGVPRTSVLSHEQHQRAPEFWYTDPTDHGDITAEDVYRAEITVNRARMPTPLTSTLMSVLLHALVGPMTGITQSTTPPPPTTPAGGSTSPNNRPTTNEMMMMGMSTVTSAANFSASLAAPLSSPGGGGMMEDSMMGSILDNGYSAPWAFGDLSPHHSASPSPPRRGPRSQVGSAGRRTTAQLSQVTAQRSLLHAMMFHDCLDGVSSSTSETSGGYSSFTSPAQLQREQRHQMLNGLRNLIVASKVDIEGDEQNRRQIEVPTAAVSVQDTRTPTSNLKGGGGRGGRKGSKRDSLPPPVSTGALPLVSFSASPHAKGDGPEKVVNGDTEIICPEVGAIFAPNGCGGGTDNLEASSLVPFIMGASTNLTSTSISHMMKPSTPLQSNSSSSSSILNIASIDDVMSKSFVPLLVSVILQKSLFFPAGKKGGGGVTTTNTTTNVTSFSSGTSSHSSPSSGVDGGLNKLPSVREIRSDNDDDTDNSGTSCLSHGTVTFDQVLNHPLFGSASRLEEAYGIRLSLYREAHSNFSATSQTTLPPSSSFAPPPPQPPAQPTTLPKKKSSTDGAAEVLEGGRGGTWFPIPLPQWALSLANDETFEREVSTLSTHWNVLRTIVPLSPYTLGNLEPFSAVSGSKDHEDRTSTSQQVFNYGAAELSSDDSDSEETRDENGGATCTPEPTKIRVRGLSMYARDQELHRLNDSKARKRLKLVEKKKRRLQRRLCAPQIRTATKMLSSMNGAAASATQLPPSSSSSGPPSSVTVLGFTSTALIPPLLFDWRFVETVVAQMI